MKGRRSGVVLKGPLENHRLWLTVQSMIKVDVVRSIVMFFPAGT